MVPAFVDRDGELDQDAPRLLGRDLAQHHQRRSIRGALDGISNHVGNAHALARDDAQLHRLRHGGGREVELAFEHLLEVGLLGDVVVLTAALIGKSRHQALVVVVTEAHRGDRHAVVRGHLGDVRQPRGRRDPLVRLPIAHQDDPVDMQRVQIALYFGEAREKSAGNVGAAVSLQPADCSE